MLLFDLFISESPMAKLTAFNYSALSTELKSASLATTPAELHGLLTGMLVGGLDTSKDEWQSLLFDYTNDGMGWPMALLGQAKSLLSVTNEMLTDASASTELLLPEAQGDEGIFTLADGLGDWVDHFISGFGLMNIRLNQMSADSKEALQDLEEIAKLGIDEDDDLQEQADLLGQVIEHVKACTLMLHAEFGHDKPQAPHGVNKPTIH
jgi:uncharacterized protein YgfB (UPF0149 family)